VKGQGEELLVLAATRCDFVVAQRCHPEAFAEHGGLRCEIVLGARLEKAQKAFDNRGRRVMSFKVHKSFSIDGEGINEGGFLRVVD
jgi:hypothetical protein